MSIIIPPAVATISEFWIEDRQQQIPTSVIQK